MNETIDRQLADWLNEGPETGPREGMERALAATRRVGQRPAWTLPERWLPRRLSMTPTWSRRPILALAILALLVVALVVGALAIGSLRLRTPALYRNGAIVYEQDGDLFIADELGGTTRPLVAGPPADGDPVFSPQGDRVAFVRDARMIMSVGPDGADVTELGAVDGTMKPLGLGWSPDGHSLLASFFGSGEQWYQTDVIASDGSGSRRLGVGSHVVRAVWRPVGRQLLFCGLLDGDDATRGVYIADADGANVRMVPSSQFTFGCHTEWSPDGTRLAFASSTEPHPAGIDIADVDEHGAVTDVRHLELDPTGSVEGGPTWSPDGRRLAVVIRKGDAHTVAIVDPDGSGYRVVVPAGPTWWDPRLTWSPDGRLLVIVEVSDEAKVWSLDLATGARTEVRTPVETWQRLPP
jgi:Tol biopolymer transport system component